MAGRLGYPHLGFPENVQKIILKEVKPLPRGSRPGNSMESDDFEKERAALKARLNRDITNEEVISSLLYPKVFSDFLDYEEENSVDVWKLPSSVFWYGMEIGQTFEVESSEFGTAKVTMKRVGPLLKGAIREVTVVTEAGGETATRTIKVKDDTAADANTGPMADPENPSDIGSPMSGSVENVLVAEGATVEKGAKLAVVGAMKMEVDAVAPFKAKVSKLLVSKGSKVVEGSLLLKLEKLE